MSRGESAQVNKNYACQPEKKKKKGPSAAFGPSLQGAKTQNLHMCPCVYV